MNKLLDRKQSGSSLLVFLLISLSLYFSYSQTTHGQFPSSVKILKQSTNHPPLTVIDPYAGTIETTELEVDHLLTLFLQPRQETNSSIISNLSHHKTFALFKVPLLFMLFDIPPPIL